jgi:hypothetical protein
MSEVPGLLLMILVLFLFVGFFQTSSEDDGE